MIVMITTTFKRGRNFNGRLLLLNKGLEIRIGHMKKRLSSIEFNKSKQFKAKTWEGITQNWQRGSLDRVKQSMPPKEGCSQGMIKMWKMDHLSCSQIHFRITWDLLWACSGMVSTIKSGVGHIRRLHHLYLRREYLLQCFLGSQTLHWVNLGKRIEKEGTLE